jgi:ketosteroid isomerase-like protein
MDLVVYVVKSWSGWVTNLDAQEHDRVEWFARVTLLVSASLTQRISPFSLVYWVPRLNVELRDEQMAALPAIGFARVPRRVHGDSRWPGCVVDLVRARSPGRRVCRLWNGETGAGSSAVDSGRCIRTRIFLGASCDARASRDDEAIAEQLDENVIWHVPGRNAVAGEYRGIDQVLAYNRRRRELADGTFVVTMHDVLANDEHGLVIATGKATRGGEIFEWGAHGLYRFRNARIAECWVLPEDQLVFDEVWS